MGGIPTGTNRDKYEYQLQTLSAISRVCLLSIIDSEVYQNISCRVVLRILFIHEIVHPLP